MGISWGYHGNIIGISWGYHGDIMGISWGYHGNIMAIFCKKTSKKGQLDTTENDFPTSTLHGILMGRCLVIKMGSYPLKNGSTGKPWYSGWGFRSNFEVSQQETGMNHWRLMKIGVNRLVMASSNSLSCFDLLSDMVGFEFWSRHLCKIELIQSCEYNPGVVDFGPNVHTWSICINNHGSSWIHVQAICMDNHGLSWIIMDYHGLSWIIMDYHGLSRIIMDMYWYVGV